MLLSFRWYAKQLKKSHKATRYYEIVTAGQIMIAARGAKFQKPGGSHNSMTGDCARKSSSRGAKTEK